MQDLLDRAQLRTETVTEALQVNSDTCWLNVYTPQNSSDSVCAYDQIKRTRLLITSVKTLKNEDCSTALAAEVKEAEI